MNRTEVVVTQIQVLVVDDVQTIRSMVKKQLNAMGIRSVFECADGNAAWNFLINQRAEGIETDLVIADWNMPTMSGLDLLKKIRAEKWGEFLPFLMLTSESNMSQVIQAIDEKVTRYLLKPFTAVDLEKKVKQCILKKIQSQSS